MPDAEQILIDYEDVNKYIDIVSEQNQYLVENIIPDFISIAELRYVLVNLIREKVSIRDIVYIFEKINDFSDEACKEALLDKIRFSLARYIGNRYANIDGTIQGLEMSAKTISELFDETEDSVKLTAHNNQIAIPVFGNKNRLLRLVCTHSFYIKSNFYYVNK